jgi:type IV pilus assembly protein PilO
MSLLDPIIQLPRSRKIVFGALALVLAAGLGFLFVILPKLEQRARMSAERDALRVEVARARADEANLRHSRAEASALQRDLRTALARLPSDKEMPALYRQITELALESGLQLAVFAPKRPEGRDVFTAVPIAIVSEGTYHQLGIFASRLGQLSRVVNVGDFRLTGIGSPTGTIRAELTLEAFVLGALEPSAPPSVRHTGRGSDQTGSGTARR